MPPEGRQFDALRERLLVGGIAPRRVKRYLAELDDHLAELTEREQAAGYEGEDADIRARAALGSDDELAESWLSDPQLRSLTARAPWAVLPVLLALFLAFGFVVWIPLSAGAARAGRLLNEHGLIPSAWFPQISGVLSQSASFATPPLIALAITLLVWRQRLNVYWTLLPVVFLLAAGLRLHIEISPHDASVGAGFVGGPSPTQSHGLPVFSLRVIALQASLIAAPALWLTVRRWAKPNWRA